MRPGHFFTSCEKAMTDLDWAPEYATVAGLRDSFENDFLTKKVRASRGGGFWPTLPPSVSRRMYADADADADYVGAASN